MPIPNHLDVVKRWRAVYGFLSGTERAFQVCNGVAWELRAEGCGLYAKPSGPHGVSQDVLIFKPGAETFDVLRDAEGAATPQWSRTTPSGFGDLTRWRAATEPVLPGPQPPDPPDPPNPEPPPAYDDTELRLRIGTLELRLQALEQHVSTLSVTGQTGRSFGHSHSLSLPVE